MHAKLWVFTVVVTATLMIGTPSAAVTVRTGFSDTTIASGLAFPTTMEFAPDGRLFVAEQSGTLRVIKDGALLPTPFLALEVSSYGERGLLGIAFDPQFTSNRFVYVYYTATTPTDHNRVSRFTANGDVAEEGSEVVLLELPELEATTHNGGAIHFGPDGMLYIAVGDAGLSWEAQDLASPFGKMLRIRSDGTIPPDNPFIGVTTGINQALWAVGLRNPFTFTFDPFSGRMVINDVGEDDWEEIDEGIAGANYGWPETQGVSDEPGLVNPIYAYGHIGGACAITGGDVYPTLSSQFPADYAADYFFADFCAGWIRHYDFAYGIDDADFVSGIAAPVNLLVGPEGSLYYLSRGWIDGTGLVGRIDYAAVTPPEPPNPSPTPTPTPTPNPEPAPVIPSAPPVAIISSPAAGASYVAGARIAFAGSATDPEDGAVPASRLTWRLERHHGADTSLPVAPIVGTASGSFVVPTTGDPSPDVWYRVRLSVTDSTGQEGSTFVDLTPRTVQLTIRSSRSGPWLTLDGEPVSGTLTFRSVVGMSRTIGASSPQTVSDMTYQFRSWSDRGAETHVIVTPSRRVTFTATFRAHRVPVASADGTVPYAVLRR